LSEEARQKVLEFLKTEPKGAALLLVSKKSWFKPYGNKKNS
jgi:hypothetical protein